MTFEISGSVLLENRMPFPFNDSARVVVFPCEAPDREYDVVTELVSADGNVTEISVSDRALNGFRLSFIGDAHSAEIRYTVRAARPFGGSAPEVPFSCSEGILNVRDGELTLDLKRYERDHTIRIIIGEDEYGCLTLGAAHRYLLEAVIPPREYAYIKGDADDIGLPRLFREPLAFDPDRVRIDLLNMEEK